MQQRWLWRAGGSRKAHFIPISLLSLRRCSGSSRDGSPGGVQDTGGGLRNLPQHGGQHQRQLHGVAALRGGAALLRVLQQPQRAVPPHADPRPARPGEGAARPSLRPKATRWRGSGAGSRSHLCPLRGHAALQPLAWVTSVPAAEGLVLSSSWGLSPGRATGHCPHLQLHAVASCGSRRPCPLC